MICCYFMKIGEHRVRTHTRSRRVTAVESDVAMGSDIDVYSSRLDTMIKVMKVYKDTIICIHSDHYTVHVLVFILEYYEYIHKSAS